MDTPRVQYAKTEDGVSIAFAAAGNGPPLLLLDGFIQAGLDHRLSENVEYAECFRMVAAERLVVAFDWRGSGLSGAATSFGLDAFVLDIEAVLAQAKIEQFDVFAYTTPCHVAVELALRYPNRVRRMVLASPSPPATPSTIQPESRHLTLSSIPTGSCISSSSRSPDSVGQTSIMLAGFETNCAGTGPVRLGRACGKQSTD